VIIKVEAVGRDAKDISATPGNIVAIRPMKDGVIAARDHRKMARTSSAARNRSTLVRPHRDRDPPR
jgi:actin-like ATPase involved in cell morphogenesis